jgi:prefoldin subunit 5
LKNAYA